MRQKIVLQNAKPALLQDDGSLTTNEIKKFEVLSVFLHQSSHTNHQENERFQNWIPPIQ